MQSIPRVMIWEMFSHGWLALIGGLLGANLLPVLLFSALRAEGNAAIDDSSSIIMHVVMVQINMFIFWAAVSAGQTRLSRLYAYPVRNSTIVTWQMLPTAVIVALELILSTVVLNALFDLQWPLWGPALFLAATAAAIQAVVWFADKSGWLIIALCAVAGAMGCWFKMRYGTITGLPTHYWRAVTPAEVATLAIAGGLSYWAAVVGVGRNRRGEPPLSVGIIAWFERVFERGPSFATRFRSPAHAHVWYEWRKKAWVLPATVAFSMVVWGCIWLLAVRRADALWQGLIVGGGLLSLGGLLGGIVMGNMGHTDSTYEMSQFLGTRPMTNTAMARVILKVVAQSVFAAWLIWAAALLVAYVTLRTMGALPRPETIDLSALRWWYLPATLLGFWITTATLTSMFLSGRAVPFVAVLVGLIGVIVVQAPTLKYVLSREAQELLLRGELIAVTIAFLVATAAALIAARRKALIGWPTVYVAASIWAALTAVIVLERMRHPADPILVYIFCVGLAALAVAPLASAPLTLAWNRNR